MEVDTNELLHRIGAVLRGISDKMDRLIAIGESLESQIRLPSEDESKTFSGAKDPAKEPPKKWRILEPGEVVCSSDWVNAKSNLPSDPPNGLGWRPAIVSAGLTVLKSDGCVYARPVADEPEKEAEPEHPAGPQPDPGEGYRLLSKDPPEDLQPGDDFFERWAGQWRKSRDAAEGIRKQNKGQWYRRKMEQAKSLDELICEPVEPILPKVGDWVRVTRPENWEECADPCWSPQMHRFDGRVGQIEAEWAGRFELRGFANSRGIRVHFHRDWLQAGWSCPSPVRPTATKEPEPEHPAGPMPDPGEGYRILSKNPPEELMPGDEAQYINGTWGASDNARTHRRQGLSLWYRRKIETPKPAWEPKVGDWVRVTRPQKQDRGDDPIWLTTMDQYDGKVFQVKELIRLYQWPSVMCDGINCAFKIDWLSPAEPPAIDKPPEPEYREPVLPADFDRPCDFSSDGIEWRHGYLRGYVHSGWRDTNGVCWPCCRIKKDA